MHLAEFWNIALSLLWYIPLDFGGLASLSELIHSLVPCIAVDLKNSV